MNFPDSLVELLYQKLTTENFDSGNYFQIAKKVNEFNQFISQELIAINPVADKSDVFLIDHAWTTRINDIRAGLAQNSRLLYRMKGIVRSRGDKIDLPDQDLAEDDYPSWEGMLDMDGQSISVINDIDSQYDCLSLSESDLENLDQIMPVINSIKGVWVDGTPLCQDDFREKELLQALEDSFPHIEVFNSYLTRNASQWALQFVSRCKDLESVTHLDLTDRHIERVNPDILRFVPNVVSVDLRSNIIEDVWIQGLASLPYLKKLLVDAVEESKVFNSIHLLNLKYLNQWDVEKGKPELIDGVIQNFWQYAGNYRLITEDQYDESSIWYIMDEVGCSVFHSDEPNVCLQPFLYQPDEGESISYSLMWPIKDISAGQYVYRDMLAGIDESMFRSSRLAVWFNVPKRFYKNQLQIWLDSLGNLKVQELEEGPVTDSKQGPIKLYCDYSLFSETLTDERYELVKDPQEADFIFTGAQIFNGREQQYQLQDHQLINQFPNENAFLLKSMLSQTVQKVGGIVDWFPMTFKLNDELPALIGEYYRRDKLGLDNHWIVKPINMSRSMDTYLVNNLDAIIRMMETGPKVCQKYVERPLLRNGLKFDLRYIVILRSMKPIKVYLFDKFWVRSANNPFTLAYPQDFDYETHFTVMNYGTSQLQTIMYYEFIEYFEQNYEMPWAEMQEKINKAMKSIFTYGAIGFPQIENKNSRAMYGVDLMIDQDFNPQILEVNFFPDCKRATVQFPTFTNDIFNCMVYDELNNLVEI